jgi:enoyl reductase-like protein
MSMNRNELLSLCDRFASHRHILTGRLSVSIIDPVDDPAPEIIRSFRQAEISESEKNALLSLVQADEEEPGFCDEMVCIMDPYADAQAAASDDDIG